MNSIANAGQQHAVAAEILRRLNEHGASAWPHTGGIRVRPKALVPADLLRDVKAAEPQLLEYFAAKHAGKAGSTKEGRKLSRVRSALRKQLGRPASPVERQLVSRIAWLRFHVASFDQAALRSGGLSVGQTAAALKTYASLASQLGRAEDDFDARCNVPAAPPSHSDWLASISRATRQEADPDDDGDEDGDL
jgi:hypothetical protein